MNRPEFIAHMEAKGYTQSTPLSQTYLRIGLTTIGLNDDDSLSCSSPGGSFDYKTFDDFIANKPY